MRSSPRNKEGIIRFWSPGAERIFGYARSEAIGQSLDIIIPERLRKRYWDGYHHVIRTGESRYWQRPRSSRDQTGRRRGLLASARCKMYAGCM